MAGNQPILNRRFKKWETFNGNHENYRTKRTQLVMMMKRGYYVPNEEIQFISYSQAAMNYIRARDAYFSGGDAQTYYTAQTELLEESENNTYEEFMEGSIEFVKYVESRKGGGTFRDGMSMDYQSYIGRGIARVIFLNYLVNEKKSKFEVRKVFTDLDAYNQDSPQPIQNLIIIAPQMYMGIVIEELSIKNEFHAEILSEENMKFDPTMHKLQPWFKVMSDEEAKKFTKNRFQRKNLPKLNSKDAVLQFLGLSDTKGIMEYHRDNRLDQIGEVSFYARVF